MFRGLGFEVPVQGVQGFGVWGLGFGVSVQGLRVYNFCRRLNNIIKTEKG